MEISVLNSSLADTVSFLKKHLHLFDLSKSSIQQTNINDDCYFIITDKDINLDFDVPCELNEIGNLELAPECNEESIIDILNNENELNFNIPKIF